MQLKFWGVRGSLPAPVPPEVLIWRLEEAINQYARMRDSGISVSARDYLDSLPPHQGGGYGGNTLCAEVTHGNSRVLIDGGSGIRRFSEHIMRTDPTLSEFHIYMTHFHWDHLIGLPFFVPIFMKGKTVHFYCCEPSMEKSLKTLFCKPNFPVPFEVVSSQIKLHRVEPRQPFKIGEIQITPYQLDHPDPCWGARLEAGGKSLAWAVDTEGTRSTAEQMGPDVALYRGADLLVFDAQYTYEEALEKINWGHSYGPLGIEISLREGIKQSIFIHHDPSATDEMIHQAEEGTRDHFEKLLKERRKQGLPNTEFKWHFGREGEVLTL